MEMLNQNLTRQSDLIPIEVLGEKITIIGAGAIGSLVAWSLAKMGFGNLTVIDFDMIEVENMNCQLYGKDHIGRSKVDALQYIIERDTGFKIEVVFDKYTGGVTFPGIVVSAVDSMAVRKTIWDAHEMKAVGTKFIIDPRMSIENCLQYVSNPSSPIDASDYRATLYTDEDAVQEPCTNKATIYTSLLLAGHVVKTIKDLVLGLPYARVMMWSIAKNDYVVFNKVPSDSGDDQNPDQGPT